MPIDTLQKFKSSLNRGVNNISQKTQSSIEKVKIKSQIDTLENEIRKQYTTLGELTYTKWELGDTDNTLLEQMLNEIRAKKQEIELHEAEMAAIDERDNQILNQPAAEAAPAANFCPGCGSACVPGAKFCLKCGSKL